VSHNVIFIVIGLMLVFGVVFAIVWWQLADVLFPGASKKTGQKILPLGEDGRKGPPPGSTVIRGFEPPDRPQSPPQA
jgi:hypothetical protein